MLSFPTSFPLHSYIYFLYLSKNRKIIYYTHSIFIYVISCSVLCKLWDSSQTGSSVLDIFQARILEWVGISSSRASSQPRNQTHISYVSCIAGEFFTIEPLEKPIHVSTMYAWICTHNIYRH